MEVVDRAHAEALSLSEFRVGLVRREKEIQLFAPERLKPQAQAGQLCNLGSIQTEVV